jgi:hypothetical protein
LYATNTFSYFSASIVRVHERQERQQKADAEGKKSLFLLIGLTASLAMTLVFYRAKVIRKRPPEDLGTMAYAMDEDGDRHHNQTGRNLRTASSQSQRHRQR